MKISTQVIEVEGEGLMAFMNKSIVLFCGNYIYTGILIGVNDTCVKLQDAHIVYETGSFDEKKWKDAQKVGDVWYIQTSFIESFGNGK